MDLKLEERAITAEAWVCRACAAEAEKPARKFTLFAHVINGVAHATDGFRFHWAKTIFPNGVYDAKNFLPVTFDGPVTDFERLKPTAFKKVATVEEMYEGYPGDPKLHTARIPNGPAMNYEHLAEGLNSIGDKVCYRDWPGGVIFGASDFGNFVLTRSNAPAKPLRD